MSFEISSDILEVFRPRDDHMSKRHQNPGNQTLKKTHSRHIFRSKEGFCFRERRAQIGGPGY